MTKRGIYHNLYESEYAISNTEIALFFSSRFYMHKFLSEYKSHRMLFKDRVSRAMRSDNANTDYLADINLYKEIEKRGYLCISLMNVERVELEWQKSQKYGLLNMTKKNSLDWFAIHGQKFHEQRKSTT